MTVNATTGSRRSCWQLVTLGVLAALWLGLSGLLVVARGKPEAFLVTALGRFSRPDAFENLNGVTVALSCVHSFLLAIAIAAVRYRRTDVLAVLMVGPVIASAIALIGQRWSDPNWFEIVAVCAICWLVSAVVGGICWVLNLRSGSRPLIPAIAETLGTSWRRYQTTGHSALLGADYRLSLLSDPAETVSQKSVSGFQPCTALGTPHPG